MKTVQLAESTAMWSVLFPATPQVLGAGLVMEPLDRRVLDGPGGARVDGWTERWTGGRMDGWTD